VEFRSVKNRKITRLELSNLW